MAFKWQKKEQWPLIGDQASDGFLSGGKEALPLISEKGKRGLFLLGGK
jgi:hypothetical protein